jgi:competence protein ComEC
VASVRFGRVRFLLVGDAEAEEERWLLARDPSALRADVLKVGPHGSATSTTSEFLAAVAPRVALVSVGANNVYGHPSMEVMRALREAGADVLRTDRLGAVVVHTDGDVVSVAARGERWRVPARTEAHTP